MVFLQGGLQPQRGQKRLHPVVGSVGRHRGDGVLLHPLVGGDGLYLLQIGAVRHLLGGDLHPGHHAEQLRAGLVALVQAENAPVLLIEAGRPHRAEGEHHGHRGLGPVPIGVDHGQAVPRRAPRHRHLADGIPGLLRGLDDLGHRRLDLVGLGEDAGLRVRLIPQGVVDARRHVALGAQPRQHIPVVRLVPRGEAAGVEIDHQAVAAFAALGGEVEVELVGRPLAVGEVGFQRAQRVAPLGGVFFGPGGLNCGFGHRSGPEGQQKYCDAHPDRHSLPPLFLHRFAHRTFPPNSVPPTRKFSTARTASRPSTNAGTAMAARINSLFCVNDISDALP